jgi:hypothetical protein
MKRIGFTEENFRSVLLGLKTQTRRIGTPKYQVGDTVALLEPTQVLEIFDDFPIAAYVYYPWGDTINYVRIGGASYQKLVSRSDWKRLAQPRFMLNDFARYFVKITGVKVQGLQAISREDAIAEGVEQDPFPMTMSRGFCLEKQWRDYLNGGYDLNPVQSYASMWAKIHGDNPNTGWNANPDVTAYTFEVKS